mmetsp:Transcript_24247/g.53977  ORF Transcript_24247/g.53977 Transcript_24247/m.53977 type:complete len:132 (+) Transcript_24247:984-1379(+)|eukprot:CAMPEP_0173269230 /NCGR_PEP_ID=MMETSP1142-20121109/30763_1 /TAXON_ID=483371 /ORGANISM="non described non described, Strain CCMP2298" /LENGTH=131 /DNA_ID=CAMNT_0014205553 /DNA_START=282 /DNA_END=677 /DNA_ORIENTATION=+
MSRADDEILELGGDGSFDIKTSPVKQLPTAKTDYDSFPAAVEDSKKEILTSLSAGEFKIYKAGGSLFVIVRLAPSEAVEQVGSAGKEVVVRTVSGKKYVAPLDNTCGDIDAKNGSCTSFEDFVTIKYPLFI